MYIRTYACLYEHLYVYTHAYIHTYTYTCSAVRVVDSSGGAPDEGGMDGLHQRGKGLSSAHQYGICIFDPGAPDFPRPQHSTLDLEKCSIFQGLGSLFLLSVTTFVLSLCRPLAV